MPMRVKNGKRCSRLGWQERINLSTAVCGGGGVGGGVGSDGGSGLVGGLGASCASSSASSSILLDFLELSQSILGVRAILFAF